MSSSRRQRDEMLRKARSKLKTRAFDYCSRESWKGRFPCTAWLPEYRPHKLYNDTIAGLAVGLTILPQGLAYAAIAKLPSVYGLYASIMGGFLYAVFGMSKDVSVGPTAIMSLLVSQYGTPLIEDEELNDPTYAILLAFFCGIIQLIMGVLHLGFIANYISAVVISGFTSASAVTIAMSQLKSMLGIRFSSETFIHDLIKTCQHITETRWQDLSLGLCCILTLAIMRFCKNKAQHKLENMSAKVAVQNRLPWQVLWIIGTARNAIVVVLAAAINYALNVHDRDDVFHVVGNVTSGLPPLQLPHFTAGNILKNLNVGLIVIPLIAFMENVAIAKGFGRQNNYRVDTNQELVALGYCNIGASLVSGFPITASFSRSAINNQSGVMTPLSGMVTGVIVLLSLAFLTPVFYFIPKASLAAVIIFAVIFMVDYQIVPDLWRVRKIDLIPLFATFLFSLWLGVEYGTIIGIIVDIVLLLYPYGRPGLKTRTDQDRVVIVHLEQGLRFPAVASLQNLLDDHALLSDMPQSAVIDFSSVSSLDYSVIEGLKDTVKSFRQKRLTMTLVGVRPKVQKMLDKAGLDDLVTFGSVDEALSKMTSDPHDDHDLQVIQMTSLLSKSRDRAADAIEVNIEKTHRDQEDVQLQEDYLEEDGVAQS